MDAQKLGAFIAETRKEQHMTQAELAEKLHVTDKAVSKWERGLGFPDIKAIEPLADAMGVSVMEVMRAEKMDDPVIAHDAASAVIIDTFELVKQQRKIERKHILWITSCVAAAFIVVFLIDNMTWMGFLAVRMPIILLASGLALLIYSIWRKKNQLSSWQSVVMAAICLLIPLVMVLLLFLAGLSGSGPVPN